MNKLAARLTVMFAGAGIGLIESRINPRKTATNPNIRQMLVAAAFGVGYLFAIAGVERAVGLTPADD